MKKNNLIFVLWFVLVCLWNFGFPEAPPVADIAAAVILSVIVSILKKKLRP
tara:strand:- start:109 stop:261 length:153 start_codon:yes stop_codon:yes gene_type:complete